MKALIKLLPVFAFPVALLGAAFLGLRDPAFLGRRHVSASAPVLPSITGLVAWYDGSDANYLYSDDGVTKITVDGTAVYRWDDKSGSTSNLWQNTEARRPAYKTGIQNGLSAIRFDSADTKHMFVPNILNSLTWGEVFMVLKMDRDPATMGGQGNSPFAWGYSSDNDGYPYTDGNCYVGCMATLRQSVGNPALSLTNCHVLNISSQTNSWVMRINGTNHYSTASNTYKGTGYKVIGATGPSPTLYFDGYWMEIIQYNHVLSSDDRTAVENYLEDKWGL